MCGIRDKFSEGTNCASDNLAVVCVCVEMNTNIGDSLVGICIAYNSQHSLLEIIQLQG